MADPDTPSISGLAGRLRSSVVSIPAARKFSAFATEIRQRLLWPEGIESWSGPQQSPSCFPNERKTPEGCRYYRSELRHTRVGACLRLRQSVSRKSLRRSRAKI